MENAWITSHGAEWPYRFIILSFRSINAVFRIYGQLIAYSNCIAERLHVK